MASPSEKLAQSLELLERLQNENGIAIVHAADMTRTHKERLVKNGFLKEVIKGWYISKGPEERDGDTTSWYTSFWHFAATYINSRFGDNWCLSPEQSLLLHSGNKSVPTQLIVRSPKANNNKIDLIHGTSFFDIKLEIPKKENRNVKDGIQLFGLEAALIAVNTEFFRSCSVDARICLSMIKDSSQVLSLLLAGEHSVIAGRLAGAFRNIGKDKIADDIISTMKSADFNVREEDPFQQKLFNIFASREVSPYANRIRLIWGNMREGVIDNFPKSPGFPVNAEKYLKQVDEYYSQDAYHSLSIEGYRVTQELIERVRQGDWNPDEILTDKDQKDAMAARGYYLAFEEVKNSIRKILNGKNAGEIVAQDHGVWYRELFSPSVIAGILKPTDLAGYRNSQVYIKGSKHTPPNFEAVRDAMPILFELLQEESEASVRVVLGHFIFVYIHPYMDGNGRIGRFIMNTMLAAGGYPWTIIPVEKRNDYMAALEKASINQDIVNFTKFIASLTKKAL